jgi:Flp pilus assembly protein TadB
MPQGEPQTKSQAEVGSGPEAEYRARLSALEREQTELHESDRRYVGLKLVLLAALVIVAAWLVKYAPGRLPWLAVIVALLVVTFVLHERVLRRIRTVRQRKGFYERGLARLEGRWTGTGRTGEPFLDQSHPYARDLDLFGTAGLFELLCTARTSAGERLLADWLLAAAPIDEITRRQAAVRELAPQTDFQERMALAGEDIQTESARTPEALANWAEAGNKVRNPGWLRFGALVLAVAWTASVLLWLLSRLGGVPLWEWGWVAAGLTVLNAALSYAWRKETAEAAEALEAAGEELPLLAAVFAAIERENFRSEKLASLQARLRAAGETPSRAIAKLNDYREWIVGAHNLMVQAVDPVVFWSRQWVWAAERWRARYGAAVREWMLASAEIEALLSLAIFAREHPEYVFPEFASEGPYLEAEDLAHPLVLGRAVGNDVKLGRAPGEDSQGLRLIIISGPNMAGKSTFTRSVGVNAVLAQAGAPVRARRMVLSELQVAASICVLDSLAGGLSRFYAEITRLKQIYDLTGRDLPVLFLLDELLSGTNSHDRRVGTESIVRGLLRHRAIGIVTTHDLALTEIVGTLNGTAANYHFGDTFRDGKLSFDYRLSPGIAETTNALQLMQSIGLTGE